MWNLLPVFGIRCPFALGMSSCTKCLGPFAEDNFKKCSNVAQDILMLFRRLVDKLSQQELERWAMMIWAMMIWAIWNAWNKYYFEHIQIHPKTILNGALGFLQEYQRLVADQSSNWQWSDRFLHVRCIFA